MEESEAPRYWCHMCSQRVNPITEIETIKCPICESGFVEEMTSATPDTPLDSDSDRALSLWAPILLGMMDNPRRRRRLRRQNEEDEELDHELESIIRRRRSSATILQLLQGMRTGLLSETDERENERVILINPFNQTIIVQGDHRAPIGSLGDYFIGPGLDLLLQHLSENDPNRYGTPPAQKEAVEGLPTVKIEEKLQCSVCLDECEIGDEVKEMPCKHKFHSRCILPWLELHSSCPICRYQLPFDESKVTDNNNSTSTSNSNGENSNSNSNSNSNTNVGQSSGDRGRQFSVPLPWPFSSLFSSGSSSNANANPNPSSSHHQDEN